MKGKGKTDCTFYQRRMQLLMVLQHLVRGSDFHLCDVAF